MEVKSCKELLSILSELSTTGPHYFRGYQKENELVSSLGRKPCDGLLALKDFAQALYEEGFPVQSFKQLLALAQHYGVPTNLIDLTTDPLVSAFFGLGREKVGTFHILFAEKHHFDEQHSDKIRKYPVTLGDIGDMTLAELGPLSFSHLFALSEETQMSHEYLQTPIFDRLYDKFYNVQRDYTLVPYEKDLNLRIEKQKGLFILSKNKTQPLPTTWFQTIDVDLGTEEVYLLIQYLSEHGYTDNDLLPPEIGGVNISEIAYQITQKHQQ